MSVKCLARCSTFFLFLGLITLFAAGCRLIGGYDGDSSASPLTNVNGLVVIPEGVALGNQMRLSAKSLMADVVKGKTIKGAEVWIRELPEVPHQFTNDDGTYSFAGVSTGNYHIVASFTLPGSGEERHGSDIRIKRAVDNSDQIVLFYRNRHHATFIFMGEIFLLEEVMHTTKPSEFIFSLLPAHASSGSVIYETVDPNSHEFLSLHETDRKQLTKARIGQNNFRKNLIKMWGKCSVTGVENLEFLNASHINLNSRKMNSVS